MYLKVLSIILQAVNALSILKTCTPTNHATQSKDTCLEYVVKVMEMEVFATYSKAVIYPIFTSYILVTYTSILQVT